MRKKTTRGVSRRQRDPPLAKCLTSKMEVCVQIHMASIRSTFIIISISSSSSSIVAYGLF